MWEQSAPARWEAWGVIGLQVSELAVGLVAVVEDNIQKVFGLLPDDSDFLVLVFL